jgi:hypothetical protein
MSMPKQRQFFNDPARAFAPKVLACGLPVNSEVSDFSEYWNTPGMAPPF